LKTILLSCAPLSSITYEINHNSHENVPFLFLKNVLSHSCHNYFPGVCCGHLMMQQIVWGILIRALDTNVHGKFAWDFNGAWKYEM
jgi:hypothetical protein